MTAADVEMIDAAERERAEFEAKTTAFVVDGREVKMAEARATFDKYHKSEDWKDPVDARNVPFGDVELLCQSILFYHGGARPRVTAEKSGSGVERGYRVTNRGYAC